METNNRNATTLLIGLLSGLALLVIFYYIAFLDRGISLTVMNFNALHKEMQLLWVLDFAPIFLSVIVYSISVLIRISLNKAHQYVAVYNHAAEKSINTIGIEYQMQPREASRAFNSILPKVEKEKLEYV